MKNRESTHPPRFPAAAQPDRLLASLAGSLDRALPVPLNTQLRGLIEFGIALGELQPGQRLPAVRELAERAGIAPMTVATVYRELRLSGLLETKAGAGTYVGALHAGQGLRSVNMRKLQRRIDNLFNEAESCGLAPALVASMVNARIARGPTPIHPVRLMMVGNFLDTTQLYADRIYEHLCNQDMISATTVDALKTGAQLTPGYDLWVTLAHRRGDVEALLPPGTPLVGLSFIPAEETRAQLAIIDPMARVGIVSVFPEFMPLMKPGVLRFTPHIANAEVRLLSDPGLKTFLQSLDVLVYASGAEATREDLLPGKKAIEFRYVPDPHAIQQTLIPAIEKLRAESVSLQESDSPP